MRARGGEGIVVLPLPLSDTGWSGRELFCYAREEDFRKPEFASPSSFSGFNSKLPTPNRQ